MSNRDTASSEMSRMMDLQKELTDLKAQFAEYVKAEELRRISTGKKYVIAAIKSEQQYQKAKQTLGL
jgi:hypothetical protein